MGVAPRHGMLIVGRGAVYLLASSLRAHPTGRCAAGTYSPRPQNFIDRPTMTASRATPEWADSLHPPVCDLRYAGCTHEATQAYRVHGCYLHYTCDNCSNQMMETLLRSFSRFSDMYCKSCGMKYELPTYVNVIRLGTE